jgi:hypothetical protein
MAGKHQTTKNEPTIILLISNGPMDAFDFPFDKK